MLHGTYKLTMEVSPGITIEEAAARAQDYADKLEQTVVFDFNGVECFAVAGGSVGNLVAAQMEAQAMHPRVFSDDRSATGVPRFNV